MLKLYNKFIKHKKFSYKEVEGGKSALIQILCKKYHDRCLKFVLN